MFGLLALPLGSLITLALLFLVLIGVALAMENPQVKGSLRRTEWFRRFEALPPSELRFRGMVSLGVGVCCFAALLTLKLFAPVSAWAATLLGVACVCAVTLGAALLERAASIQGLR